MLDFLIGITLIWGIIVIIGLTIVIWIVSIIGINAFIYLTVFMFFMGLTIYLVKPKKIDESYKTGYLQKMLETRPYSLMLGIDIPVPKVIEWTGLLLFFIVSIFQPVDFEYYLWAFNDGIQKIISLFENISIQQK